MDGQGVTRLVESACLGVRVGWAVLPPDYCVILMRSLRVFDGDCNSRPSFDRGKGCRAAKRWNLLERTPSEHVLIVHAGAVPTSRVWTTANHHPGMLTRGPRASTEAAFLAIVQEHNVREDMFHNVGDKQKKPGWRARRKARKQEKRMNV